MALRHEDFGFWVVILYSCVGRY